MAWLVYKHTNKINGKIYIGITCQKPEVRWGKDGIGYKPHYDNEPTKFWNAICKYGWDGFTHDIIEEGIETAEDAAIREKYWVKYYNSYLNGYNSDEGGRANNYLFKPVLQISMKDLTILHKFDNISLAEITVGTTSISGACHRHYSSAGGYYWCFEKDYYEDWLPPENNTIKTAVYQIDKETLTIVNSFDSILQATRYITNNPKAISTSCIQDVISGRSIYAYGYYWCKQEDYSPDWQPRDRKIPLAHAVVCWDTGEIFESACKVRDKYDILIPNIIACCTGKTISAKGLHFCYLEDYENGWQPRKTKREKPVICYETLEVFESASAADRWLGLSIGGVHKVCSRYRNQKIAGDYHWCWLENWTPDWTPDIPVPKTEEPSKFDHSLIHCIETGQVFHTYIEASQATGASRTGISKCCQGKQKTAGGFHWKYAE